MLSLGRGRRQDGQTRSSVGDGPDLWAAAPPWNVLVGAGQDRLAHGDRSLHPLTAAQSGLPAAPKPLSPRWRQAKQGPGGDKTEGTGEVAAPRTVQGLSFPGPSPGGQGGESPQDPLGKSLGTKLGGPGSNPP